MTRRVALVLEYDGSRYGGSQFQTNAPSIQQEVESAIEQLTGEFSRVAFAGRTDAGVHARGQVAAFSTPANHLTDVFVRGLNALLPDDIAVRKAVEVDQRFDPRRHATGRTYRYTVYNVPQRAPLQRDRAWHVIDPLNLDAMRAAAATLAGEHDFAAFTTPEQASTVRCLQRVDIERKGSLVRLELDGNAFLRNQVRRTAGALVRVGTGKLTVEAFGELLRKAEPASAGPVAPAQGLCLLRVSYGGLDLG